MDHNESCCIFDTTQYTGVPDSHPCPHVVDVPALIRRLDVLYAAGREAEAGAFLEDALGRARQGGDWRAELSILSEQLGQVRRSMDEDRGLRTVNEALRLIREHHMGQTVSAATMMLNAATTLKCFGRADESIPIFTHVARVYADHLDPSDYRFAGLYNNMALSYEDVGDYAAAERHFKLAMQAIGRCPHPENELAVTFCNLAELYDKQDPEDPRCAECMERAWENLNAEGLPRDGYHAFTVSKCIPSFDYFGFFLYAAQLRERVKEIYERT